MSADFNVRDLMVRLEKLEKQSLFLKCACAGLATVSMAIVLMGQAAPASRRVMADEINTRAVVVRDEAGRMRAWLGTADEGTRLVFFDEGGQQKAGFGLTANHQPAMALFQATDKPLLVLGIEPGNWPSMLLYDMAGRKRATLSAEDEWSSIFFFDKNEKRRAAVGYVENGGALNLFDEHGRARAGVSVATEGSSLVFFDEFGQKRAGLGANEDSVPLMGMFDSKGRSRIAMIASETESMFVMQSTNKLQRVLATVDAEGGNYRVFDAAGDLEWSASPSGSNQTKRVLTATTSGVGGAARPGL